MSDAASDHDPLSLLRSLVASLIRSIPGRRRFIPEDWARFADGAGEVRRLYREAAPRLFAVLYRWLRDGLDDQSFAEARKEVEEVESRAKAIALVTERTLDPIYGARDVAEGGVEIPVVFLHGRPFQRLREQAEELVELVIRLDRWRDCRKAPAVAVGVTGNQGRGRKAVGKIGTEAGTANPPNPVDLGVTIIATASRDGTKLDQSKLARRMGVSRTSLRDALRFAGVRALAEKKLGIVFGKREDKLKWDGATGEKTNGTVEAIDHRSESPRDGEL